MFKDSAEIGDKISFPYVIYSKKNLSKYIKHLKKSKINSLNEIVENTEDNNKALFFKYLKSLSS